jgi:hypothetical protein
MAEYTLSPGREMMTVEEVNAAVNGRNYSNTVTVNLAELAFEEWLAASDADKQKEYQTYRDYYAGLIGFTLTPRMLEFFELRGSATLSYNYIPLALDTVWERMAIDYFEVSGEDENTPVNKRQGGKHGRLMQWFNHSRLDAGQDDIHLDMLVDGDSFVLVDWDDEAQMPLITSHKAYVSTMNEGAGDGIYIAYQEDDRNKIKFAVRSWRIETGKNKGHTRLNVYTANNIYKYITGGGGYVPYVEMAVGVDGREYELPWPRPWVNPKTGKPIGLTVIHFGIRNSFVGELITFQDSINKTFIDEMAGADIEGFQMITLSGGDKPVNEDGTTISIGPRHILHAPEGTWGSIGAGDLDALSKMVDNAIRRLVQRARTSLKHVTGQVSSADGQAAAESNMVSRIEAMARRTGNAWEDVFDACRRVYNAFGPAGDELEEGGISAIWKSFERVDTQAVAREEAITADTKSQAFERLLLNGVPRELAARLAKYTDEEAAEMAVSADDFRLPEIPDVGNGETEI